MSMVGMPGVRPAVSSSTVTAWERDPGTTTSSSASTMLSAAPIAVDG